MFCSKITKNLKFNLISWYILGSIYSAKASGAEQMPETNNSNESKQG